MTRDVSLSRGRFLLAPYMNQIHLSLNVTENDTLCVVTASNTNQGCYDFQFLSAHIYAPISLSDKVDRVLAFEVSIDFETSFI